MFERIFKSGFSFPQGAERHFCVQLYSLYANQYDIDFPAGFEECFTEKELRDFWEDRNLFSYLEKGPGLSGTSISTDVAFPLLGHFLDTSEHALATNGISANLRFGHAETIIPFASLLELPFACRQTDNFEDVSSIWHDYQISPMSANLQWVFYRNKESHVLVKMLFNENEVPFPISSDRHPYYDWNEVNEDCRAKLQKLAVKKYSNLADEVKFFRSADYPSVI